SRMARDRMAGPIRCLCAWCCHIVSLTMDEPTIQVRNSVSSQWMTDHRFTDSARRFIHDAQSPASDRGISGKVSPVLILWAMLRWERKVGMTVLEFCGVDVSALERDTELELRSFPAGTWRDGIDLIHFKTVATQAVEEAELCGHHYVGSEHLVLALFRNGDD